MKDLIKYYCGGGCEIVRENISEEEAVEMEEQLLRENKENSTQNCYFCLIDVNSYCIEGI